MQKIFPPVLLMIDVSSHWSLIMWVWFIPSNSLSVNTVLDTLNSGNRHKIHCFSNFLFHGKNLRLRKLECSGCIRYCSYVFVCVCGSSAGPGSEEEVGGNSRQRHNRHGRDGGAAAPGSLEKRMEELEKVRLLTLSFILPLVNAPPIETSQFNYVLKE